MMSLLLMPDRQYDLNKLKLSEIPIRSLSDLSSHLVASSLAPSSSFSVGGFRKAIISYQALPLNE
jgi:hypothetical protein